MSDNYCANCQHPISEATTCNHPKCEYKMQEINKKLSELEDVTYTQSELDEALIKQREEIKSELIASVNVIFRPHIEGVFGVIENKLNATIENE